MTSLDSQWPARIARSAVDEVVCRTCGDAIFVGLQTCGASAVMRLVTSDWYTGLAMYSVGCALTRALRANLR